MTNIDAVLFDMDGVLYSYDFENRLNLLESALEVSKETIREKIFKSGFEDKADLGEISTQQYIDGISERLGVEVTLRQWLAARKWAMAPDPGMLDLARTLKTKVPVALLTNNGYMMAEHIDELAPELPALFDDKLFVSASLGEGKEQAEAFVNLLHRLGWKPETTLFVDDNPVYIAEAENAGLVTHLFDGIEGLRSQLGGFGLV